MTRAFGCWLAAVLFTLSAIPLRADEVVDYLRDIKPLLAQRCNHCHGAEEQEGGLRLDAAQLIRRGGDRGVIVVAGQSDKSSLYTAITGEASFARMPLEDEPLSKPEIDLIKRWIEQGAKTPEEETVAAAQRKGLNHWAFKPVRRPEPPQVKKIGWVRNAIDHFILARLEKEGLEPSARADRETLIRRLSLDLLGVLPTPQEVAAFENDTRPDAYEQLVDNLLASPHYGERWGRHWLDAARYADSNGYTIDGPRSIWKYRDWVIDAVNADMPFDQFTIEQVAGDMLPDATRQQTIATGFHRNTLINQEGGTDQEQFRVEAVADRINTTGSVFLGLTLECARCHTHKYDPISQREYYELFALFNNADEPTVGVPTPPQKKRLEELQVAQRQAAKVLGGYDKQAAAQQSAWEAKLADAVQDVSWTTVVPSQATSAGGATFEHLKDQSLLVGGEIPASDTYEITLDVPLRSVSALRLETLTHESLPMQGPGLAGNGNFVLTDLAVRRPAAESADQRVIVTRAVADHSQADHPVDAAIDQDAKKSGWAINVRTGKLNVNRTATFIFSQTVAGDGESTRLVVTLTQNHPSRYNIGRFRLSATSVSPEAVGLPPNVSEAAALAAQKRSKEQQQLLNNLYQQSDPQRKPLAAAAEKAKTAAAEFNKGIVTTMIMKERAAPRETHIHIRGNFLDHGARVKGDVPAVLHSLKAGGEANRLDFARWLVDAENPLTPRVTMNRIWQRYFGHGLVETENDFGTQGEPPTHPNLLDWLADEFIQRGWSLKAMHRLIVGSATYQQSSQVTSELLKIDPYNKLLARQSRVRLEAESIRDAALAAAGVLSDKVGGPGVYPPQPEGIYVFTQNKKQWPVSQGEDRFRRGMYIYFWRSSPDPFLMTFDAPKANVTCTRRVRSNTPLQALTLANDQAFVEIAGLLAVRILNESPSAGLAERLQYGFELCLSRSPAPGELALLSNFFDAQTRHYAAHEEQAEAAAPANLPEGTDKVQGAAWSAVARVMLNLDEFITRE